MGRELIDWSQFRSQMSRAADAMIGTKEAIESLQLAFLALQAAFVGDFPCVIALFVEDTDTWASNLVATGVVNAEMNANRLTLCLSQDDKNAAFPIKSEFVDPVSVEFVILEPDTHDVAYRFTSHVKVFVRAQDQVRVLDTGAIEVRQ